MAQLVPYLDRVYTDLGNLAQLDPYNGVVLLDYSIKNYPKGAEDFAYFHELYHILYNTTGKRDIKKEMMCDLGAANELVQISYTKTQILGFMDMLLKDSPEKRDRINNVDQHLNWMSH